MPDPHQTAAWPRVRLQHHAAAGNPPGTRLDLGRLTAVSEPTEPISPISPILPPSVLPVGPIPERTRREAPRSARLPEPAPVGSLSAPDAPAGGAPITADLVGKILDQQHELNLGLAARIRRIGPGGIFGWRPLGGPTLAEVAAARQKIAEREERRRVRHQRHLDVLEVIRAYLGIFALVLLVLFVGGAALLALGILSGQFVWSPVERP